MQARDRLIVAIDRSSRGDILTLVDRVGDVVGMVKIGLQAFIANGPSIVREVRERGVKVFVDLKVHDIPNTAGNAVREVAALDAAILTVHASGGEAMLKACAGTSSLVLGVTVLTSLDEAALRAIGFQGTSEENVVRLARLVQSAGLPGVVASPLEIEPIRGACGEGFLILTPGIRPAGTDAGDQRRTMTPRDAVRAGADYLVVGRPITDAVSPRDAALAIVESMDL